MKKGAFVTTPLDNEKIQHILELGINEISISWHNYSKEPVNQLRNKGVSVFAEISLFVGKELWEKYPDSRPIGREGKQMEPIHWYHGVCPNHPGVQQEHFKTIDHIISEFDVDGIWLDFIRYPCHWEEVRSADVTEYCFCEHCQEKFADEVGGPMQGDAWIQWKCAQITAFVKEVHDRIKTTSKPIELGVFAVPWSSSDFDGGIKRIIGQDFTTLAPYIDIFGPMAYHKIMENPVEWIHDITRSIYQQTGKPAMPLVQSIPVPETVIAEEFASSLKIGKQSPADGVMVFHFEDMLEDTEKTHRLKKVFNT